MCNLEMWSAATVYDDSNDDDYDDASDVGCSSFS